MRKEIKGKKIILRKYESGFAEKLFEAAFESRGGEFTHWMPWCHENYSIKDTENFIELSLEKWETQNEFNFAVFDSETEKIIGGVGLNNPNFVYKFYNLGYWTRISAQKRGIASEAAQILARSALEDLDINRIEILAAKENFPSQKAAEKSGAIREGILRNRLLINGRIHDAVMFSFIKEDF